MGHDERPPSDIDQTVVQDEKARARSKDQSEELPELRTQLPGSIGPRRFSELGDHLR